MSPARAALLISLFATGAAWAQFDDLPDAGLPDASVGGTGAERASEEEEDATQNPCLSDNDCDRGLQCKNNKCSWRPWRDATVVGCASAPGLLALALLAWVGRRHFFVNFTK